jgi:isopentenyl diphosphate isomerase/L-lactate dehydrogenase-like FMN-dependent dehydrogenase
MCLSSAASRDPAEVAAACIGKRWFQVYVFQNRALTERLIREAIDGGFRALAMTVDTPFLGLRERDVRVGFRLPEELEVYGERLRNLDTTLSWRDLEWLAGFGVPLLVKGILTAEDAELACAHGADGIVVSNHGGRQLDGVPATIDALPEVVDAIGGRCEVYLDGGVRRGTDVIKALALGARAVLIGRAFLWGLAAAGEEGVADVLRMFREELQLALALLGCASPAEVSRSHVRSARRDGSP